MFDNVVENSTHRFILNSRATYHQLEENPEFDMTEVRNQLRFDKNDKKGIVKARTGEKHRP